MLIPGPKAIVWFSFCPRTDRNMCFMVCFCFFVYLFVSLLRYWGLNSGPTPWATPPALCEVFFWNRVSWTVYLGWLWTVVLLIPASWVARNTGVSHRSPPQFLFCFKIFCSCFSHPEIRVLNKKIGNSGFLKRTSYHCHHDHLQQIVPVLNF
jgi:hypothetical protein